jgi:hypothetical protein
VAKRVLEMNDRFETVEDGNRGWVSRLSVLDIEEFGPTEDAAHTAAVGQMFRILREMGDDAAKQWIEDHSTVMTDDYVPECFVPAPATSGEPFSIQA